MVIEDLWDSLNKMWSDQMFNCCGLPCSDNICRSKMNREEGGCEGANFADKLKEEIERR